jgi:hypothetical protein
LIKSSKVDVKELIAVYEDWKIDYIGNPKRLEQVLLDILDRCGIDYEEAKKGL